MFLPPAISFQLAATRHSVKQMHSSKTKFGLRSILLVAGLLASFIPAEAQTTAPLNQPSAVVATNSVSAETPPPTSVAATNQPARVPPPAWATADAPATVTNQPSQVVAKTAPANNGTNYDSSWMLPATEPKTPPAYDSIDSIREKAEAGDAKSQTELGDLYQAGKVVPPDFNQAAQWYRKAADQGYAAAQAQIGICYAFGTGVKRDYTEATKWYRKAADQGDAVGEFHLGLCYQMGGDGVDKDVVEAVRWYRKAADQGNSDAETSLALCYQGGTGVEQSLEDAIKWFQKAADGGSGLAKSWLADCIRQKQDDDRTYAAAMEGNPYAVGKYAGHGFDFLKKRADSGDVVAQYALGTDYQFGYDIGKSPTEAVKCYQKAADQGFAPAETTLSDCYATGTGIKADQVEAMKWIQKAADEGYASAQTELGNKYRSGRGVAQNPETAIIWYLKAADQNFGFAQNALGDCYLFGNGVGKDPSEATKWYLKAAYNGVATGDVNLGLLYCNGFGVIKNETEGLAWLYVASVEGNQGAVNRLPYFERLYGPDTVAAARKRAGEIQTAIPSNSFEPVESAPAPLPQTASASQSPKASGSGTFISSDGLVLTAAHVVQGASRIQVITATGALAATVVKIDATNDVALLKCSGSNFTPLPIVPSKEARAGTSVFTVGFPNILIQGFDPKLTKGEISSQTGYQDDPRQWQISVPTQPGNSGGPLCDENGNIIGMVESTLNPLTMAKVEGEIPQNVNYAVKSSYILPLLDDLQNLPPAVVSSAGTKFEDVVGKVQKSVALILVY